MTGREEIVRSLAAVIQQRDVALPPEALALAVAEQEGVVGLVADALKDADVPAAWRTAFTARAHALAALDLVQEAELRQLLERLHDAGVEILLMKGAHLAYSCYSRPDLRPRLDADLLVRADDRARAQRVLTQCGFTPHEAQQDGDLLMYQATFVKTTDHVRHVIDLHWRVLNPQVFADVFTAADLFDRAVPLPRLGAAARALNRIDALLLACVHRIAHHQAERPLIWSYDIHLLGAACHQEDWRYLLKRAIASGAGPLVRRSLLDTQRVFGTEVPQWFLEEPRLAEGSRAARGYLEPARHATIVLDDLRSLPDWRSRWRLLLQYGFPAADYMRRVYAPASRLPLPLLYGLRLVRGGGRWLRRDGLR